jgi:hypothetical protein
VAHSRKKKPVAQYHTKEGVGAYHYPLKSQRKGDQNQHLNSFVRYIKELCRTQRTSQKMDAWVIAIHATTPFQDDAANA